MLARKQFLQVIGGRAEALGVEHAREQLVGRLLGLERERLELVFAIQHQARLQLQQRRDQQDELRCALQVELAALVQVVDV